MAEIIAANVCGETLDLHILDRFIGSVRCGSNPSDFDLNSLDTLLTKNDSSLKGVVFARYNKAVLLRTQQEFMDELEVLASSPDYIAEQHEFSID